MQNFCSSNGDDADLLTALKQLKDQKIRSGDYKNYEIGRYDRVSWRRVKSSNAKKL